VKQKTLLGILIAIVVLLGVYFYIANMKDIDQSKTSDNTQTIPQSNNVDQNSNQASNTQADTTNWKAYKNSKYSYSINYPADWLGGETSATTDYAIFYKGPRDAGGSGAFLAVKVDNSNSLTLAQWWNNKDSQDGAEYESLGQVTIAGSTAYRYREVGGLGENHTVFLKDGKFFDLFSTTTESIYLGFINSFNIN